jgi:hypothetical protein
MNMDDNAAPLVEQQAVDSSGLSAVQIFVIMHAAAAAFQHKTADNDVVVSFAVSGEPMVRRVVTAVAPPHLELSAPPHSGNIWPAPGGAYSVASVSLAVHHGSDDVPNEQRERSCFRQLGDMHPDKEPIVPTFHHEAVSGGPLLRIPGWTWLFQQHRAAYVAIVLIGGVACVSVALMLEADAVAYTIFNVVWGILSLISITVYQRGVADKVVRTFDFWYFALNYLVYTAALLSAVVHTNGHPSWVYCNVVSLGGALAAFLGFGDAMPDYRYRVTINFVALFPVSFNMYRFAVEFDNRDVPIHNSSFFQTTWGAVGMTAGFTVFAFLARGLVRAAQGQDFLFLVGCERFVRRQLREQGAVTEAGRRAAIADVDRRAVARLVNVDDEDPL